MRLIGYGFLALMIGLTAPWASAAATDLVEAAMRGDTEAVRSLIDDGVDVNAPYGDGSTALHWAAGKGNVELTRLLLASGAKVDAKTRVGAMTPLFMAARSGEAGVVEALLEAGADANAANENGTTVLMSAAGAGDLATVDLLIEAGADVNALEATNGQTALMFAASLNRADAIRALIGAGAETDIRTKVSELPESGRGGRRSGPASVGGMTALHFAARDGQIDAVRALVEGGADVNVASESNHTPPITEAIINANLDIANVLLEGGADVTIANGEGLTPLYATIDIRWRANTWYPQPDVHEQKIDYLDLAEAILDAGAEVDARLGKRLWYRGFRYGNDWVDPSGATAFWRAAQANDLVAMRLLAARGANPTIPTSRGVTPLMVAAGMGHEYQATNLSPDSRMQAVRYLVEEIGADVKATDNKDFTTLHAAAYVGDNELIHYLVALGGDVAARASSRLSGTRGELDVGPGEGESVADMANGPREKSLLYPETVALLENLGSANSQDCRSTACVNKTRGDTGSRER